MAQRDYYDILGVSRQATAEEIKRSYRKLARELHPDVNKAPDAEKRFSEVQEAYAVLSDAEKRKAYDRFGAAGVGAGFGGGGRPGGTYRWTNVGGDSAAGIDMGDIGSIFEELLGGGRSSRRSPFAGAGPQPRSRPARRGEDIQHELSITFYTAVVGGKETVGLTRYAAVGPQEESLSITIPPGVVDGAKLRLAGKGQPGAGGSGDLILTIRVGEHPYFRREGLDLLIEVPVSIAEAALGVTIELPLYPEGSAEIRIPPGSGSGQKLRLRGKGARNDKGKVGDLYAVLKVVAPKELSPDDQALLRGLAQRLPPVRTGRPWVER